MATSTGDGSTVSFGNAPKAQADSYTTTEDAAGVDGTGIILLNVLSNDTLSGGATLYSVDDGTVSAPPVHGGDADLLTKDTVYSDTTLSALLAADGSTTDTSALGARIWITSDGKIAYDTSSSAAIEALAQGQTATDSFVYAIKSGSQLYWTTVTLTVTGTNDAPVLQALATSPPAIMGGGAAGSNTLDTSSAVLSFTDVDAIDTHTAGITYAGASVTGGATLPFGLDAILASAAQVGIGFDSQYGVLGTVDVDFSAAHKTFDFLGQGQTLTVTYDVTVSDHWGGSSTQPVSFTINGANHTPALSAPTTAPSAIVEAANTSGSLALDNSSATLAFTDVDPADTHTASVSYVGDSWSAGQSLPLGLDTYLALFGAHATIGQDSTNGAPGVVNVGFSVVDSTFDFLGQGQTFTVTYNVTVTDSGGAKSTQPVTFTVSGTNDTPVLSADPIPNHAITESSTPNSTGGFNTTLRFVDPDLTDTHTVGVGTPTFSWTGTGAPAVITDAELAGLHARLDGALSASVTTDGPSGVVTARFSPNGGLDFLAAGQTLTITYGVAVSDTYGASAVQPVTITVTGTNDAPRFFFPGPLIGSTAYFTDPDFSDTHTATLTYAGAQWSTGGALPAGLTASLLADATATVTQDTTNLALGYVSNDVGSVNVAFNAANANLAFLGVGESLTVNYNLTIDDGHGGTDVKPVTFTVSGTNDAPAITSNVGGSTSERPNDVGDTANRDQATDTISFTDPDLNDTHTVTLGGPNNYPFGNPNGVPAVVWSGGAFLPSNLLSSLYAANVLTFTESDSTGTGSGSVGVTFSAADSTFDFLAAGETLTLTYAVTITDSHGLIATAPLTFTINGADDAPVLAPPTGVHTFSELANTTGSTAGDWMPDWINYSDPDVNDHHTVSATAPTIVWSGGSTLPAGLADAFNPNNPLVLQGGDFPPSQGQSQGQGQIVLQPTIPDHDFDFLAAGETLTVTYNVTVADNHGLSATQPVTYVITGTNDAPQTTFPSTVSIAELSGRTGDTTDIDSATSKVLFTDPDLNDTHANPTITLLGGFGASLTAAQLAMLAADTQVTLVKDSTGGVTGEVDVTLAAPDSAFDFLSANQTLTLNYALKVTDNHGLSTAQPVIINVIGANDPPVLNPDATGPHTLTEQAGLTGSSAIDTLSATLTYADPDLIDSLSGGVGTTITWSGAGQTSPILAPVPTVSQLGLTGTFHPVPGTNTGSYQLSLSAADSRFDFLAQGETLTVAQNVTVSDNHGGTSATQPVSFVITGTNDAPVLAADPVPAHAVSGEPSVVAGQSTPDTGFATLRFTDVDYDDTHQVSVGAAAAVLSTGGALPDGLQAVLDSAIQTTLHDSTHIGVLGGGQGIPLIDSLHEGIASGSIGVAFSAPDSSFDFLAAGQSLTVTYEVTVTDNNGLSSTLPVTFTIEGANYAPVFAPAGAAALNGTATADEFVFGGPIGADTINAFDPTQDAIDLIGFDGFSSFADVQAHTADDASGDAVIALANGESITLSGVSTSSLTAANVLFDPAPAVFNTATLTIGDGAVQVLGGQVVNTGTIALGSTGDPTALDVAANGMTLTGGGSLILSDSSSNAIHEQAPGAVLTNIDNTISGAGQIGDGSLALINDGTINATGANALVLDTTSLVNNGRIMATGAGGLRLTGSVTGSGLVLLFGSSTIEVSGASNVSVLISAVTATLKLDDPTHFTGSVGPLLGQDHIDLVGIAPTATAHYVANPGGQSGVLTVSDGIHTANINFIGQVNPNFKVFDDHLGGSLVGYL
jgi:VCBS repeat-containing protein